MSTGRNIKGEKHHDRTDVVSDKALLNQLQGNLPVCSRPFAALAEKLGTEEQVVIERLNHLKKEGYLRRIGTFFNLNQLG